MEKETAQGRAEHGEASGKLTHTVMGAKGQAEGDFIRKIAQFPLQTVMGPGQWVNFADTVSICMWRTISPSRCSQPMSRTRRRRSG